MLKKISFKLLVITLLITSITSCSKKADYVNAIPSDTQGLISFNLKTLFSKSGLNNKDNEASKEKVLSALKSEMSEATYLQLEKIFKDPKAAGLDLSSEIYIFSLPKYDIPVLLAKTGDQDKLQNTLETFIKEDPSLTINKESNFNYIKLSENLFAYNETTALFVLNIKGGNTEEVKAQVAEMLKFDDQKSIKRQVAYQKMAKKEGDIHFLVNINEELFQSLSRYMPGLMVSNSIKDASQFGSISFENGKIVINAEYYTENEEALKEMQKQLEMVKTTKNIFTKYFPDSTLMFMNINIDGSKLCTYLKENKEIQKNIPLKENPELEKAFKTFSGDFSVALTTVGLDQMPVFLGYAEVKDGQLLADLYTKLNQKKANKYESFTKIGEDKYLYKSGKMSIFAGVEDHKMYITNSESAYQEIFKKKDQSIEDAPYFSQMKNSIFSMSLNIKSVLNLPMVKMLVGFGGEEYQMYYNLCSKMNYITITSNKTESETILAFEDQKTNALKQIVDFSKTFVGM